MRPLAWCDAHHIKHWVDGGETSVDNAVLLCGYHHRLIHKGEWRVRLGADRQPEFLPPEWIDPEGKPVRNTMHCRHERSPGHSRT
jgi:HNH endonuclease